MLLLERHNLRYSHFNSVEFELIDRAIRPEYIQSVSEETAQFKRTFGLV